jgi:hypothetical protein
MKKTAMVLKAMVLLLTTAAFAQPRPTVTVVVKEGQDIRAIAREYLNDPDMWNEILKANQLASPAAVQPGMSLKIPATEVSRATIALSRSADAIEQATQAGSQLFAADAIARAIDLRNQALAKRRAGLWAACLPLAESARTEAELALSRSKAKRNVVDEAVLSERKGMVQTRGQADPAWAEAVVNTKLKEGQKVRTLADSAAEVRFTDGSRLRLNENSQAVIQRMRSDLFDKKQEQSVSLIEGDASALLDPGGRQRNKFALQAGGAQTQVRSTKFWIKKEAAGGTRFANYEGELEVSSGGKSVVLKANQGATVQADSKLSAARDLLPAPGLTSPANEATSSTKVTLSWEPLKDAKAYWLEISTDSAFKKVLRNRKELREPTSSETGLADGIYFWRVAAIDSEAFPGPKSEERAFRIFKDATPPYLALHTPRQNARLRKRNLTLTGEVEPGATLLLGGKAITADADGKFSVEIGLAEGANTIALVATDPAGNASTINRNVMVVSESAIEITYDAALVQPSPRRFVIPDRALTLSGRTEPGAAIRLNDAGGAIRARTYADTDGSFRVAVTLGSDKEELTLAASLEDVKPVEQKLTIEVDHEPPQLTLRAEPPAVTTAADVRLEGTASGARTLTIDGRETPFTADGFKVSVPLKPGPNALKLVAIDSVGNTSTLVRNVILDQQPPKLVKFSVTPRLALGGDRVQIRVTAEDESALREAARFTVQVGSFVHTGFLKLVRAEQAYVATLSLPDTAKGEVRLTNVTLHDYHGNFKEYQPK